MATERELAWLVKDAERRTKRRKENTAWPKKDWSMRSFEEQKKIDAAIERIEKSGRVR